MSLSFSVEVVPGKPLVIISLAGHYVARQAKELYAEIVRHTAAIDGEYYRILDTTDLALSFTELVRGLSIAVKGTPGSASDPRVIQNVYVGTSRFIQLVTEAYQEDQYGNMAVPLYENLDDALAFVDAQLG